MIPRRGGESGNMPSDSGNKNRLLPDSFFHQTTLTGCTSSVIVIVSSADKGAKNGLES